LHFKAFRETLILFITKPTQSYVYYTTSRCGIESKEETLFVRGFTSKNFYLSFQAANMNCLECIERVIKERRSHRFYQDRPVEREKLEKLIELAMWAPSAMNRQQWFFVVVSGQKLRELIKAIEKSYDLILPRLKMFFSDKPKVINLTKQFFKNLGNAPVAIFAYYTPTGDDYSDVQSVSASIQNILLAAHAMGLGSCWMTGPVQVEDEINKILGISGKKLVAVITIGYPAKVPPVPPRRDCDKKVIWMTDGPEND